MSYRFFVEAKRLWELKTQVPQLTTMQTGMVINMVYGLCSLDSIGHSYTVQAMIFANKLSVFGPDDQRRSKRTRSGRAYTAWMLYAYDA